MVVDRPGLLVRIGHLCFWETGVQFTLSVRLKVEERQVKRLVSTFFDTMHDGAVPLRLQVLVDDRQIVLDSQSVDQQRNGYGRYPAGSHGAFGTTPTARFDDRWWLTPIPLGPIIFEVSCPAAGLEPTEGVLDLAAIFRALEPA